MEENTPDWMETIDHTADIGIVVRADTVSVLFERAARGMFLLIADLPDAQPNATIEVVVEAPDREALLVRWLSELNFLHHTENMLFCEFEVMEWDDEHLRALARGETVRAEVDRLHTEIKAVTYHGLRVEQKGGEWEAQVLFDV